MVDSEVLEYSSFEQWANVFGYNEDSREAEKVYNVCLATALKFNQIGAAAIGELKEVYQDY